MDTGKCSHGRYCNNVHIRSLQDFSDIRTGHFGKWFLHTTLAQSPDDIGKDLTGFFTPSGAAYEWEYPYYGIALGRPFYCMQGYLFSE